MNKILLLLLASTVGLGLVSLHLVRQLREARDNSQSLQARLAALQGTLARPQAPPTPVPSTPDAEVAPPPAPPPTGQFTVVPRPAVAAMAMSSSVAQAPSQEEMTRMMRESMERQRALLQNPDYREAMKAQQKLMLTRTYPDLERELGLDAEQYEQMLSLLAEQQMRAMDNQRWGDEVSNVGSAQDYQRKAQQQQQASEAEQMALLGGEKFREWKDYQSTMPVRYQVTQLRSTLAASGVPLEQDQVKPLLKALANEQQRMMKDYQKDAQRVAATRSAIPPSDPALNQVQWQEQNLERMTQHNKRMRDAVASILSAEQLRHFERDQNEQLRMQEVQMRMMRAQAEAAASGLPSGTGTVGILVPDPVASPTMPVRP